jgi:hypothetical protein
VLLDIKAKGMESASNDTGDMQHGTDEAGLNAKTSGKAGNREAILPDSEQAEGDTVERNRTIPLCTGLQQAVVMPEHHQALPAQRASPGGAEGGGIVSVP